MQKVFPFAAQHGLQHLQSQVGAHLRSGVAYLALGDQQKSALHRQPRHHDQQHVAKGGRNANIGQGIKDGLFEIVTALGRHTGQHRCGLRTEGDIDHG